MGAIDEHWCSDCKRTLDKQHDKYLDLESIRLDFPGKKGIICSDCLQKPEYDSLRKLLGAGNPDFLPFVECALHVVCSTFKPAKSKPIRCGHIAVAGDTVYCKRRHPGSVKLIIERSERQRLEQRLLMRIFRRVARVVPKEMAEAFQMIFELGVKNTWVPPSAVIAKVPDESVGNHVPQN